MYFSPAELGTLAPDERLTFSTQKDLTDCKHTQNTAVNPEDKELTWFVHCWGYTN